MRQYGYEANANSERFEIFKKRANAIQKHNSDPNKKFTREINKFAFYTRAEIDQ